MPSKFVFSIDSIFTKSTECVDWIKFNYLAYFHRTNCDDQRPENDMTKEKNMCQ